MKNIRDVLDGVLTAIHPRVYFLRSPDKAQTPYVVYHLGPSYMLDEQEIWPLEIDVWDIGKDTTEVERIAREIAQALHRYRYSSDDLMLKIYRSSRHAIDDDDPRIKRRRLVFQVRAFDLIKQGE